MSRAGFTMIEVLVTLVLLAVLLAVSANGLRQHPESAAVALVHRARREAVATARPVRGFSDSLGQIIALPNGAVLVDSAPHLLTGGADAP